MKVLISIQYPYAIIEIPNRLENSFIKIKNDYINMLNDGTNNSLINYDDCSGTSRIFSMTIEWLSQYLINDEEIKIITLKPSDKETQNFSKKNSLFI
ncbi:hypothetical protein [uncultured Eubacterium sp.]|uniref:hypothetical protein n=1 Tax=uncultured Eubacterium sp. TaxID=165185 RepID=UPI0025F38C04|nr:hypothetical protein [uncultured Eubacterium sp.]